MKSTRSTNLRFSWSVMRIVRQHSAAIESAPPGPPQHRVHRTASSRNPIRPPVLHHPCDRADLHLPFVERSGAGSDGWLEARRWVHTSSLAPLALTPTMSST